MSSAPIKKIVALVPIRHHSQRVPGKNYRLLHKKPLFHYILTTLMDVPEINEILVDTDSEPVMEGLRQYFPQVRIIPRPGPLCADDIPMNEILLYDTGQVESDCFIQTHVTNPLLTAGTISRAIEAFLTNYPVNDSLFSVTRWQTRLYDYKGNAINHNPSELVQTQDLHPVFEENSCIYMFTRENLIRDHHRIGRNPLLFEIPRFEAVDIDEEIDFQFAEALVHLRKAKA